MNWTKKPPFIWLVLFCFYFQALWPSVAFARFDVRLGAEFSDEARGLTFRANLFRDERTSREFMRIDAYSNPLEDEDSSCKTEDSATSSKAPVHQEIEWLLSRVVDIKTFEVIESGRTLYNDLVIKEEGISWAYGGIAFVLDRKGNLLATGAAGFDMAVKISAPGKVGLDNVSVKQLLAKGRQVVVRGNGRIDRLDVWATGTKGKQGKFRITKNSQQHIHELYVHQGKGESYGQVSIQKSLSQQEEFDNYGSLQMDKGAVVEGGKVFSNYGTVEGESYSLKSALIQNLEKDGKKGTLKASESLTLEAGKLEQRGDLDSKILTLLVDEIDDSPSSVIKADTLITHLKKDWVNQGTVDVNTWTDTSEKEIFIKNKGTMISRKKTTIAGRFRSLKGSQTDFRVVTFKNPLDAYQPLINEGNLVLRKVESLGGYRKNILNKEGATLLFLEGGYSPSYLRDKKGVPFAGGVLLGDVTSGGVVFRVIITE